MLFFISYGGRAEYRVVKVACPYSYEKYADADFCRVQNSVAFAPNVWPAEPLVSWR